MTSVNRSQMPLTERFSMQVIHRELDARIVGQHIHIVDEVDSTNEMLRDLACLGASDGTVVLAESQRKGRGRLGRPWFSPPNVNFYASVLTGRRVELRGAGGPIQGRAFGIDEGSRLIVRTAAGDRYVVLTEDVRVLD
jgi:biotin-(acetyl-CoA carboxylase) ligase